MGFSNRSCDAENEANFLTIIDILDDPRISVARRPKILFLCTGNACRSQMAEAMLRHFGGDRFEAASAGSHPAGFIHPLALKTLERMEIPLSPEARSKSWREFADDPPDFVLTVCDEAAHEVCPVWTGGPIMVPWSLPDPVYFPGNEQERLAFAWDVGQRLAERIQKLVALDWRSLPAEALRQELEAIGRI